MVSITQILIFGGYVKVRESLFIRVIIWITRLILGQFCLGMKVLARYIDPNDINIKNSPSRKYI